MCEISRNMSNSVSTCYVCKNMIDQSESSYCRRPFHEVQRQEPWHRLYLNRTLSTYYKTVEFSKFHPQPDKLDFHLESKYNHYAQFNAPTSEVVKHDLPHTCLKRNFVDPEEYEETALKPFRCHVLVVSTYPKRRAIQSAKLAIERTHLMQSNAGYARKPKMGGIYMH